MRKMYSKKQIEEIAKSSGTKLYKHNIVTTEDTDAIIIISTDSSPYVVNNLSKLINVDGVLSIVLYNDVKAKFIYCSDITINKGVLVEYNVMSFSDTPTLQFSSFLDAVDNVNPL